MPSWAIVYFNLFRTIINNSYLSLEIGWDIMSNYQGSKANIDFRSAEYKDAKDFEQNFKRRSTSQSALSQQPIDFRSAEYSSPAAFQKRFKENRVPGSLIPQRRIQPGTFNRPDPPQMSKSQGMSNTRFNQNNLISFKMVTILLFPIFVPTQSHPRDHVRTLFYSS